ncbi:MAG: tRNA uridine 5-carboxymethylaminomethyl modification enzyme MnmG [Firmicutes bacterium]|nr:tRNA uridine 5-carboxymethylaminomethyl modification enzyme MnmG [candidate division NPL-UPA2 bacterium]
MSVDQVYCGGEFDCIVVGAGHAGCEAASAAARMGLSVAVLTQSMEAIACMPCNPSVGGPAKGHVVAEIDALGGLMGYAADMSFVQMRTLNTGKGPAVQALRAQTDKRLYQQVVRELLERTPNLRIIQASVVEILVESGRARGVRTHTGTLYRAKAVVVTTGTYMESTVIVGSSTIASGPNGLLPSHGLAANLRALGFRLGRLKTGTPPRIHRRSIRFDRMVEQRGDEEAARFSRRSSRLDPEQMSCWLTYTTAATHEIIRSNLHRSPLYAGLIAGRGPRYCPSIEDKVVRFADKERHQIFLEPEGYSTEEVYVQGFSTSLPEDVQVMMLRSVIGLEQAEMMRAGYAIEYDFVDPTQLTLALESKLYAGLFFAGQINGSSGYEEAAGQGLWAGINAGAKVRGLPPFVLLRSEAYLGVLVDDLVTKGTSEPYRLMTSRAEHRLLLRFDNTESRLLPKGVEVGVVPEWELLRGDEAGISQWMEYLERRKVSPEEAVNRHLASVPTSPIEHTTTAAALLRRPEISWEGLSVIVPELTEVALHLAQRVSIEVKYAGYIARQREAVELFQRLELKAIPSGVRYSEMRGLSLEAREKLERVQPRSYGQASRISGVSPADIAVLMVHLERR